ncbi:MAG: hypothetical protein ACYDAY_12030 [Candidatus Dormibacteria bacterium]
MAADGEAGATLDIRAGVELALGKVGDTLGEVSRTHGQIRELLTRKPRTPPLRRPLYGQVTGDGSTYCFISLGTPFAGYIRDVRRYAVAGLDAFATLAGVSVLIFIAGEVPPNSSTELPQFTALIDPGSAIVPNSATWGRDELTLQHGEYLVICLKGLGNGVTVTATGQAIDWLEDDKNSWLAP